MKFPLFTSFYVGTMVLVAAGAVGYRLSVRIAYHNRESIAFSSLGPHDAEQLRSTVETLAAVGTADVLARLPQASLKQNIDSLQMVRRQAPPELWPVVDLQLAESYAAMTNFEQPSESMAANRQKISDLLRSLGWQDVSQETLNQMAERALQRRLKP